MKPEEQKFDQYSLHEAMDRCFSAGRIIDSMLLDHPIFEKAALWKKKIKRAQSLIYEVYSEIGTIHLPNEKKENKKR